MSSRLSLVATPSVEPLSDISVVDTSSLPRHRWYHFKEAFSPSVVTRALEDTGQEEGALVLDPFSGSGTVPLTSISGGHRAETFEVNPFLAFVSRTKMLRLERATLETHEPQVLSGIDAGAPSPLEKFSTFSKAGGASKWLFNEEILRAFEGGWKTTPSLDPAARDLFRLSLIAAAMDVCNARKDGKCLRYRSNWQERAYGQAEFRSAFKRRVELIGKDLEAAPLQTATQRGKVHLADSRVAMKGHLGKSRFDLCVTSPPYLNSFDYTDVYRPELFLGKFVNSMKQLRSLRMKTLRSHTQAKWADPTESRFGPNFVQCYSEISRHKDSLWNPRIPLMIRAYFEDMRQVLRSLRGLASPEASVWIVVSTSAYTGVVIPVDLIIADIGTQEGWYLREVSLMRHLRRVPVQQWDQLLKGSSLSRPYLRESIVILDAKPRRSGQQV